MKKQTSQIIFQTEEDDFLDTSDSDTNDSQVNMNTNINDPGKDKDATVPVSSQVTHFIEGIQCVLVHVFKLDHVQYHIFNRG